MLSCKFTFSKNNQYLHVIDQSLLHSYLSIYNSVWPNSTFEGRNAGSYARLASSFVGERAWFMKAVLDGTAIAYTQWKCPASVIHKLKETHPTGGMSAEATEDMKKEFEREGDETCVSDGWPRGLRRDVVESLTPAMEAAQERAFPKDGEEYICEWCCVSI